MFVKLDRELTKDDVGKKVKLRNGDESTLKEGTTINKNYPFNVYDEGGDLNITSEGLYWHVECEMGWEGVSHKYDIVEIEEVKTVGTFGAQLSKLTEPHVAIAGQHGSLPGVGVIKDLSGFQDELNSILNTDSTIKISIQEGMSVIKGNFKDSSGETWYVTMDKA
jgi:hypothetical protein|tara:strand:- start:1117 stop:1611 length:495 start_codon:yes stop_codon:yes gene_type:complete